MHTIQDSLFIRALHKKPVERTPVWIMRQAGRYLPEYREIRAKAGDFLSLCQNPEWACEVTLQPLRRFALDAAIVFSDILTIPDALGLGLHFVEGEGPCFHAPLSNVALINALTLPQQLAAELAYVMQAVQKVRQNLPTDIPLIGFSGSPWTLACYMVEGKSSKIFPRLQSLVQENPHCIQGLLEKLAQAVTVYLKAQVQAGANVLMIFDTWGGLLSTPLYQQFSLFYMHYIIANIKQEHPHIPIILFTKGGGAWLEDIAASGCDAIGIDWTCDLGEARQRVGHQVALQGNLNPAILLQQPSIIRDAVKQVLSDYGQGPGHIFNLGHGITPEVPPAHLQVLIETVKECSPQYHGYFV